MIVGACMMLRGGDMYARSDLSHPFQECGSEVLAGVLMGTTTGHLRRLLDTMHLGDHKGIWFWQ